MDENKIDLNKSFETDRGAVKNGLERIITAGAVIVALTMMGHANTDLGLNPVNYPAAVWFYLER